MKNHKKRQGKAKSIQKSESALGPTPRRDEVFSTTELLEGILYQLDRRTLLVSAQRVCKRWQDLITTSVQLQQRLYFWPEREDLGTDDGCLRSRRQNPLLRTAFHLLFLDGFEVSTKEYKTLREMPIADMKDNRRRHLAFVREGASWRRMLVSQLPPRRIGFVFATKHFHPAAPYYKSCDFHLPQGLRMGQLYDMIHKIIWGDGSPGRGDHWASICWDPPSDLPNWSTQAPVPSDWRNGLDLIICERWSPFLHSTRYPEFPIPRKKVAGAVWMFQSEEFQDWEMNLKYGFTLSGDGLVEHTENEERSS